MKKSPLFLIYFCVGLIASHFSAMAAGTTTLRVGVPNPPTNSVPVSYESISTTQIDGTLSVLTAQFPTQYQYPANFTQIEADKAFVELAGLKEDLENMVTTELLNRPEVKNVVFAISNVNPLQARLSQQGTSIGLEISQINVNTRVDFNSVGGIFGSIFCPSPSGSLDLLQIKATGNYDIYTGNSSGVIFNINPNNVNIHNASCGGILGGIIDFFFNTLAKGKIENAIASSINNFDGIGNKQTLFSVRNFMESFLDSDLLTAVDSGKVLSTMDEIIMKTDLNSGLQLDIEIDDGVNNTISFVASQRAPTLTIEYMSNGIWLPIYPPNNVSEIKVYQRSFGSPTWEYVTSVACSEIQLPLRTVPLCPDGVTLPPYPFRTKIMAIATSNIVPGLNSFPSNILTINHNFLPTNSDGTPPPPPY